MFALLLGDCGRVRLQLGLETGGITHSSAAGIFYSKERKRPRHRPATVPRGWSCPSRRIPFCLDHFNARLLYPWEAGDRWQLTGDAMGRECYVMSPDDSVVGNTHSSRKIKKNRCFISPNDHYHLSK